MPEYQGPWGAPPPPRTPGSRREFPVGIALWIGVIVAALAVFALLSWKFPETLSKGDRPDAWYLFGLLALVSSGLIRLRRVDLPATLRSLLIWSAILSLLLLGYVNRGELEAAGAKLRTALIPEQAMSGPKGEVVVGRGANDGFYVAGAINGAPARFLIDTGATDVVLNREDAARAGVAVPAGAFSRPSETANGVGYGAPGVVKTLTVGSIRLSDVPVQINQAPMSTSLLGMTFLKRLDSFQIHGDQLILRAPKTSG